MAATKSIIKEWVRRGLQNGYKYLISVCDTFDHEDYPVFAESDEDMQEKVKEYDKKNMQRVNEVYLLEEPQVWADAESSEMIRYDYKLKGLNNRGLYPHQQTVMDAVANGPDTVVMVLGSCKAGSHKQFAARLRAQKNKHINSKTGLPE